MAIVMNGMGRVLAVSGSVDAKGRAILAQFGWVDSPARLREEYAAGAIDIEEFEDRMAEALAREE